MRAANPILAALTALSLVHPVAAGEAPRSVISWLSDVVGEPAEKASEDGAASVPGAGSHPLAVVPFEPGVIETTDLDDPVRNGVGLLPPALTGLPPDLWGQTSALRVRSLIYQREPAGVPAARRLYRDVMLASAEPPAGSGPRNGVLLARLDALMAAAMLDEADALLSRAGITDPELFRRAFDIGLLTGHADEHCAQLRDSPALSPTLSARVFCLARLGDWKAAALTLNLGREIGTIPPARAALLERFLDPALFESAAPPPIPDPLTTLDYILREAVALPRPSGALPLAFLVPDADDDAPLRSRIAARERLVREGAMPPAGLFAAYREGAPAASGGVWDRVAAVQALDFAFATADLADIADALAAADSLFSNIGLRHALAGTYARQLNALPLDGFSAGTRREIGALLLLADRPLDATRWFPASNDAQSRMLTVLALGRTDFPPVRALSALESAVARGMKAPTPPSADAARIAGLLDEGKTGEAMLRILDLLAPGPEIDPGDLVAALFLLRRAGFDDRARQVAAETLLLLPEA